MAGKFRWSQEQIEYLVENYPIKDVYEICNHLDMSYSQVKGKAETLKLKRLVRQPNKPLLPLTDEQIEYIEINWANIPLPKIASDLDIDYRVLRNYLLRTGRTKKDSTKRYTKEQRKPTTHPLFYNQIFGAKVGNELLINDKMIINSQEGVRL